MRTTTTKRLAKTLDLARPKPVGRWRKRNPTDRPLFGFPAVSQDDLMLWVATVAPRISPERIARYIIDYKVADKVARAKLAGQWPPIRPSSPVELLI